MMKVDDFLTSPTEACAKTGPMDTIVLSSRVRLARNLAGTPFPGWAKKNEKQKICDEICSAAQSIDILKDAFIESMANLDALEKNLLVERHLISREHAAKNHGSAVIISKNQVFCLMINEEDHIRMQSLLPGLQIKEAFAQIDSLDSALETKLEFAFSPKLGYLTACPTNLGTGIRASVMLHLPGLVLSEQINQIINASNKLGLAVRGLYGEGTEALGNIFQISNQKTLGLTETEIVERLIKVVHELIKHEEDARAKLIEKKPKFLLDHIGRAYGILSNAHSIESKEAMNLLSLFHLGIDLGLFPGNKVSLPKELFLITQPAHLQKFLSEQLSPKERDVLRADLLRKRLADVKKPLSKFPNIDTTSLDKMQNP